MFGLFARKGPFRAHISPEGKTITVEAGQNLLKAALDAGLPWPHNCRVGSCGECRSRLLSGKIKPLNDFSYVLSKEELDAGMILACQTCLRSDIEVEVPLNTEIEMPLAESVSGKIDHYQHLTHDIIDIGIKLDQAIPTYLAGQYADISIPGVINEPRSYSFASAPGNGDVDYINFFVRLVPGGLMTSWLHETNRQGTKVNVSGPYGNFWLRESNAPLVFVCGGSGLAPIKALLEHLLTKDITRKTTLIFGARTQKDLYYYDELRAIEDSTNGQFSFFPLLSEEPEVSHWSGERGLCTEHISKVPHIDKCHAYLCGPPGMVDSAINELKNNGVSEEHIFYDKFLDSSHLPDKQNRMAG